LIEIKVSLQKVRGLWPRRKKERSAGMRTMESRQELQNSLAVVPQPKPTGFTRQPEAPIVGSNFDLPGGHISARRETPEFMPTKESHVDVPWGQAVRGGGIWFGFGIFGGVIGLRVVSGLAYLFVIEGHRIIIKTDFWSSLFAAFVCGSFLALVAAYRIFYGQINFYDENTLKRIERFVRRDIDGDGFVGSPPSETVVEVNLPSPPGVKNKVRFNPPGDFREFCKFAFYVLHPDKRINIGFSFGGAQRSGYGKNNFGKLRDDFLKNKWAFIENENVDNSPLVLTGHGKRLLYHFAQQHSLSLPDNIDLDGPDYPDDEVDTLYERWDWTGAE